MLSKGRTGAERQSIKKLRISGMKQREVKSAQREMRDSAASSCAIISLKNRIIYSLRCAKHARKQMT